MSVVTIVPRALDALSTGRVIRSVVAGLLRSTAVIYAAAGGIGAIFTVKAALQVPDAEATIAGIVFAAGLLLAGLVLAQVAWYRATSVRALSDSPFMVVPIVSLLFRLAGELFATYFVLLGITGCLGTWLAPWFVRMIVSELPVQLPGMGGGSSFVAGVLVLLGCIAAGFVALLVGYYLAEMTVVLVDIALNIRRHSAATAVGAPGVTPGARAPGATGRPGSRCLQCGATLDAGAKFCTACGGQGTSPPGD